MKTRSNLRNDTPECLMPGDLGINHIGENLTTVTHHCRSGLVTGSLYAQNQHLTGSAAGCGQRRTRFVQRGLLEQQDSLEDTHGALQLPVEDFRF